VANGLRYLRVGGRGQCLGAGKTRSQKKLVNCAESHTSGARFVGTLLDLQALLLILQVFPQ